MPDVFDQVKTETGTADVFDRAAPDKPEMSFGKKALEFSKGVIKGSAETVSNISSMAQPSLTPGLDYLTRQKVSRRLKPNNPAQSAGQATENIAEYFVPIPGLGEIKAGAGAGKLAKFGMNALRSGVDVGAKTMAQTGSAKEGGEAAALGGPFGAGAEALANPVSKMLKEWGLGQYARILHPLGRNAKEVAQENAPRIIEKGYGLFSAKKGAAAFTKKGLATKFDTNTEAYGKKLEQEYQKLDATTQTRLKPIFDDFRKWINSESISSKEYRIKDLNLLKAGLSKRDPMSMINYIQDSMGKYLGKANPSTVWEARQALDKYVFKNGLTADEGLAAAKQAREGLTNVIRHNLVSQHPSVAEINDGFHLYKSLSTLMYQNIRGEFGKFQFARNSGVVGRFIMGAAVGGGESRREGLGPWETASAMVVMGLAMETTAWRSVSAVTKNKLANMIASGKGVQAARRAAELTGVSLTKLGRETQDSDSDKDKNKQETDTQ